MQRSVGSLTSARYSPLPTVWWILRTRFEQRVYRHVRNNVIYSRALWPQPERCFSGVPVSVVTINCPSRVRTCHVLLPDLAPAQRGWTAPADYVAVLGSEDGAPAALGARPEHLGGLERAVAAKIPSI